MLDSFKTCEMTDLGSRYRGAEILTKYTALFFKMDVLLRNLDHKDKRFAQHVCNFSSDTLQNAQESRFDTRNCAKCDTQWMCYAPREEQTEAISFSSLSDFSALLPVEPVHESEYLAHECEYLAH